MTRPSVTRSTACPVINSPVRPSSVSQRRSISSRRVRLALQLAVDQQHRIAAGDDDALPQGRVGGVIAQHRGGLRFRNGGDDGPGRIAGEGRRAPRPRPPRTPAPPARCRRCGGPRAGRTMPRRARPSAYADGRPRPPSPSQPRRPPRVRPGRPTRVAGAAHSDRERGRRGIGPAADPASAIRTAAPPQRRRRHGRGLSHWFAPAAAPRRPATYAFWRSIGILVATGAAAPPSLTVECSRASWAAASAACRPAARSARINVTRVVGRPDHPIDIAAVGRDVRVGQGVLVLGLQPRAQRLSVRSVGLRGAKFLAVQDVHRALGAHRRRSARSARPG